MINCHSCPPHICWIWTFFGWHHAALSQIFYYSRVDACILHPVMLFNADTTFSHSSCSPCVPVLLAGDKVEVTLVWVRWYLCSAWRSFIKRKMAYYWPCMMNTKDLFSPQVFSMQPSSPCKTTWTLSSLSLSLPHLLNLYIFPHSHLPHSLTRLLLLSRSGLINSEDKLQPCIY